MQTVNDLTTAQLLIVIDKILEKFKPNGNMMQAEFDMMVIMLAHEKKKPSFVIRGKKKAVKMPCLICGTKSTLPQNELCNSCMFREDYLEKITNPQLCFYFQLTKKAWRCWGIRTTTAEQRIN